MIKKIIVYYLVFCVALVPSFVFAGAAEKIEPPRTPNSGGVTTVGSGKPANDPRYNLPSAANDPSYGGGLAKNMGKYLRKGVGAGLLPGVLELALGGVDFLLDPANNRIKYNVLDPATTTCYYSNHFGNPLSTKTVSDSCDYAANRRTKEDGKGIYNYVSHEHDLQERYICHLVRTDIDTGKTTNHQQTVHCGYGQKKPHEIDYDEAADRVKDQAAKGNPNAVKIIRDVENAAKDDPANDPANNPANDPANNPANDPANNPANDPANNPANDPANNPANDPANNPANDPNKDNKPFELPAFCDWAPIVCSTAEKISKLPDTLKEWVTQVKDWVKEFLKTKDEKTEIDIDVSNDERPDTNIRFNGICPAPVTLIDMNFFGSRIYHQFTYDKFCEMLQNLRPIIIAVGSFIAVLIVGGVRTKDE